MVEVKKEPEHTSRLVDRWYREGIVSAHPDVIEALMHCVDISNNVVVRHGISIEISHDTDRFVLPKSRMHGELQYAADDAAVRDIATMIFERVADTVHSEAAVAHYKSVLSDPSSVKNIYHQDSKLHIVVSVNDPQRSPQEIIVEIKRVIQTILENYNHVLQRVLSDPEELFAMHKVLAVRNEIYRKIVLPREAAVLEFQQRQIGKPEDLEQFVVRLNKLVAQVGGKGVKVELLSPDTEISFDCAALYAPLGDSGAAESAIIQIPYFYGGDYLRSWDDILGLLAHELAHHVLMERKDYSHGLDHTLLEARILRRLREITP